MLGEFGCQQLAQLVGAWDKAQDRVRIQRKTPLPGVLRPVKAKGKGKHVNITVLEPIGESPDPQSAASQAAVDAFTDSAAQSS